MHEENRGGVGEEGEPQRETERERKEGRGGRGLEETGDTFLMFNEGQLCYACLYMFVCPTLSCAVGWRWGIDR